MWRTSGKRYEQLTVRIAAQQQHQGRKRTLILAGYSAGLRVERAVLVVREGYTHYPQTGAEHTLYRDVHGVERIICRNCLGAQATGRGRPWKTAVSVSSMLRSCLRMVPK